MSKDLEQPNTKARALTTIDQQQYDEGFPNGLKQAPAGSLSGSSQSKREVALEQALDIRKFEIELYWKRATYFWTFIAAALGAYGAVQTMQEPAHSDLSVFLSCIGFLFSLSWYCVNRGSKQWQENWENHVDLLEDEISGPLYKTLLTRPLPTTFRDKCRNALVGPAPFSVSKINQIISLYTCAVWVLLWCRSQGFFSEGSKFSIVYTLVSGVTVAAAGLMLRYGRSQHENYETIAHRRSTSIISNRTN